MDWFTFLAALAGLVLGAAIGIAISNRRWAEKCSRCASIIRQSRFPNA